MNRSLSGLQLRAGILVHPNFVSNGHGPILCRIAPISAASSLKRNRAIKIAQPGNARRRILRIGRTVIFVSLRIGITRIIIVARVARVVVLRVAVWIVVAWIAAIGIVVAWIILRHGPV